ncbi:MAG: imidazole glycerol-phosphate synthase subunit HisF [Candidatus Methanomethylophilaceae archaeon]|nr:imidazole glycerol-phosphate synthase subunit HisF [Candidatus Methanomethylophilaceae archaeon]MDI3542114.1 imidazole glycerol-phosphate synthase subunit HisF [Candidatus Methanomethylophilaceae archaeon]HIJ00638.1 imidazole glycerol phosphate synthase subunit HisF [Candidatus Methanomethylophilaceae archaeon]
MLTRRIIPCLDVKDGKVVKGVMFRNLKEVGHPPDLAKAYEEQGADEVAFLDISATQEGRQTMLRMVEETAEKLFIPLTVGGGIRNRNDVREALNAGADKVSINSAAVRSPELISVCAEDFGRQCVVVAIDAKRHGSSWRVYTHGGTRATDLDAVEWAKTVEELGAGEILLTSMDADGTKNGYDIDLTATVADEVSIPVIASGGCGSIEHIYEVFSQTKASAALAASIFHYGEHTVKEVKEYLRDQGVLVR